MHPFVMVLIRNGTRAFNLSNWASSTENVSCCAQSGDSTWLLDPGVQQTMKSSSVSYIYIYVYILLYCYIIPCSQSQLKSRSLQPVLSKHSPHSLKPCVAEEIPDVSAKSVATTAHFISKNVRITHQWRPPLWPLLCSSRDLFWFQFQSENCVLQPCDGISPFSKRVESGSQRKNLSQSNQMKTMFIRIPLNHNL